MFGGEIILMIVSKRVIQIENTVRKNKYTVQHNNLVVISPRSFLSEAHSLSILFALLLTMALFFSVPYALFNK